MVDSRNTEWIITTHISNKYKHTHCIFFPRELPNRDKSATWFPFVSSLCLEESVWWWGENKVGINLIPGRPPDIPVPPQTGTYTPLTSFLKEQSSLQLSLSWFFFFFLYSRHPPNCFCSLILQTHFFFSFSLVYPSVLITCQSVAQTWDF